MATHSSILAWKSHGQRSLAGYCPGIGKSQTELKQLSRQALNTQLQVFLSRDQLIHWVSESLSLSPRTRLLRSRGQGSKKPLELPPLGGLHSGLGPEGGFVFSACLSSFNLSLSLSLSFPPSLFFLSFKFSSNFYQLTLRNHLTQSQSFIFTY